MRKVEEAEEAQIPGHDARHWLESVAQALRACIDSGHKILICGNGGSAAQAQHFAAELIVRYRKDRAAIPAIALTADSAVLTACANDYGFERVFSRQVEALGNPGDVLIALSTSGKSKNVIAAIEEGRRKGMVIIDWRRPTVDTAST